MLYMEWKRSKREGETSVACMFFESASPAFNIPETEPCLGRNILAGIRDGHLAIGSIDKPRGSKR